MDNNVDFTKNYKLYLKTDQENSTFRLFLIILEFTSVENNNLNFVLKLIATVKCHHIILLKSSYLLKPVDEVKQLTSRII